MSSQNIIINVVDSDEQIILNETGPQGAQGVAGPQGPAGPAGDTGATGPKGDTGAVGPKGDKGDTGSVGPAGRSFNVDHSGLLADRAGFDDQAEGFAYLATDTGALYIHGDGVGVWSNPIAFQGPQGPQGIKGDTGATGAVGATGPAGAKGDKGDTGEQGIQGVPGDTGPAGPQGETGATGATGADGAVGPTGATGPAGDTGAAGPKGDRGDSGPQGPAGEPGPQGLTGPAGATGATGPAGADSTVAGPAGPAGPKGDTGDTGPQGPAGANGADSTVAGPQGPAGDAGATGPAGPGVPVGGTKGQVLFKNSTTNYDATWTTIPSLNAGPGIIADATTSKVSIDTTVVPTLAGTNTFSGVVNVVTQTAGDSSTKAASTAFVANAVAGLSSGGSSYTAGNGILISAGNAISADTTVVQTIANANGVFTKSLSGLTAYTLTATEAANSVFIFTGAQTASCNVIFPNTKGPFTVMNACTGGWLVTCKTATGTGYAPAYNGHAAMLYADGTNVVNAVSDFASVFLNGSPTCSSPLSTNNLAIANVGFVNQSRAPRIYTLATATGAQTIAMNSYEQANLTLTGNVTLTFSSNNGDGAKFLLKMKQNATGGFTATLPANVAYGASIPSYTQTTTAGKTDVLLFSYDNSSAKWWLIGVNQGF